MNKFEVGKTYHLMKISDNSLKKVFVKDRFSCNGKDFIVVKRYKHGSLIDEIIQLGVEGDDEVFYLGKKNKKVCRAFFKVRDLQCDFSEQEEE